MALIWTLGVWNKRFAVCWLFKEPFLSAASELNIFGHKMDTAARDYEAFEKQHKVELSKNCNRQRELEAELARLKTQEQKLEEDLTSGVMLQKEASKAREKALTDISEWNEKIVELQKRTQIALSIMTQMEGS